MNVFNYTRRILILKHNLRGSLPGADLADQNKAATDFHGSTRIWKENQPGRQALWVL
jgi:hypothetical protein